MSARVALVESEEAEASASDVLIHVRYTASGEIFFIDARPAQLSPQEWLNLLLAKGADCYQTLAGGRGFFRIPRARFDAFLAPTAL